MTPPNSEALSAETGEQYKVMVEGRIAMPIPKSFVGQAFQQLCMLKIEGKEISEATEIVLIPSKEGGQYPELFIFVGANRIIRSVINLNVNKERPATTGSYSASQKAINFKRRPSRSSGRFTTKTLTWKTTNGTNAIVAVISYTV